MNWLTKRLSERSTHAAIATLVMGGAQAIASSTDWHQLVVPAAACVLAILLPENSPAAAPAPTSALTTVTVGSGGGGGAGGSAKPNA